MDLKLIILLEFSLFIVLFSLIKPKNFVLLYFLIKPMVDWFAERGTTFMGTYVGPQHMAGILIPVLVMFYILIYKEDIGLMPMKWLLLTFVAINIYDYIIWENYSIQTFGWLARVIFPISFYFSIPYIVKERSDILTLTKMVALSGIFPATMGFLQLAGVISYTRLPETFGVYTLDRATGGYYDSFSFSLPIILAIFSILFLFQYQKGKGETKGTNKLYVFLLIAYVSILAFTYHRVAYITLTISIGLWLIYNKHKKLLLLLIILIIFTLPVTSSFLTEFFADLYKPFLSESSLPVGRAFHGRLGVWETVLSSYSRYSFSEKLLGKGIATRYSHNDFIRILLSNGICGLIVYLSILGTIGKRILQLRRLYSKGKDEFMYQFSILCQLIFVVYILASFTLAISLLSSPT
ncbi:MAG: hypothetical protein JSU92_01300, partial [Deltaproteobacteria bacterium]